MGNYNSYCLMANAHWSNITNSAKTMTGLYMWAKAYGDKGVWAFPQTVDELEKFDIIHINWTVGNQDLIWQIADRLKNSSTKLIMNMDAGACAWQDWLQHPIQVGKQLALADLVFATDKVGASSLSNLTGLDVKCLPHPCDVDLLRSRRKNQRKDVVLHWHRYDAQWFHAWAACQRVNAPDGHPVCYDLMGVQDPPGRSIIDILPIHRFNKIIRYVPEWPSFIEFMSTYAIGMDLYTLQNYGRIQVEHAALGIPLISSDHCDATEKLWPALSVNPWDSGEAAHLLQRLINDREFYEQCWKYADKQVDWYKPENCRHRLETALDEAKPK